MIIVVQMGNEDPDARNGRVVRLLNWLVRENEDYLRRHPTTPLLYSDWDKNPICRYKRESVETWSTIPACISQGWEDCDALSAWRAAELRVWGWRAIEPGYKAYQAARGMQKIRAQAFLRTRNHKLYHCLVRYQIGDQWYYDDPSLRLGMRRGQFYGPAFVEAEMNKQRADLDAQVPLRPNWAFQSPKEL